MGKSSRIADWVLYTLIGHNNMKLTCAEYDAAGAGLRAACEGVLWLVLRPGKLTGKYEKEQARVWPGDKAMVGRTRVSPRVPWPDIADAAQGGEWDGNNPIIFFLRHQYGQWDVSLTAFMRVSCLHCFLPCSLRDLPVECMRFGMITDGYGERRSGWHSETVIW